MSEEFDVSFPASSANLGPAFDTAAMALDFGLRVRARRAPAPSLAAFGRDLDTCQQADNHMIVNVYRRTLELAGQPAPTLALRLDNEIPIGKGCGSSAAARLAGVALAAHFGQLDWGAQQVFEAAVRSEGHADNVAACWWGGLVVAQAGAAERVGWLRIPMATPWPLLLVVPQHTLATSAARQMLPDAYCRRDAVANMQNAVMLLHAFQQGRADLLMNASVDHLHQPYRAALCPLLGVLQPLVGTAGIISCVLSGAGPSVLLVVHDDLHQPAAQEAVERALYCAGLTAELLQARTVAHGPGMDWRRS
ncbi:MAG TPA: homoserine kinase [Terriglobales bacterium]|nr:homoserine kinase [Terriglobales bacterium]